MCSGKNMGETSITIRSRSIWNFRNTLLVLIGVASLLLIYYYFSTQIWRPDPMQFVIADSVPGRATLAPITISSTQTAPLAAVSATSITTTTVTTKSPALSVITPTAASAKTTTFQTTMTAVKQNSASPEPSPYRKPAASKKWRICACSLVSNEAAYLPEWIEYHRLQGIDHFVLYDNNSTDLVQYLPQWYESAGLRATIDMYPARFVPADHPSRNDTNTIKNYAMSECYMRHRTMAEWIIVLHPNQFIHFPSNNTLAEFIDGTGPNTERILVSGVTYGQPTSMVPQFKNWLSPNRDTGSAEFMFEPHPLGKYPMVVETNTGRAPHRALDNNFQSFNACGPAVNPLCDGGNSVVLVARADRCIADSIKQCILHEPHEKDLVSAISKDKNVLAANIREVRVNVYPWRPRNSIVDLQQKIIPKPVDIPKWFSSIPDPSAGKYSEIIRKVIKQVGARPFVEVRQECLKDALDSGQQMKCPATHPYPFGNQADMEFLRKCCKTNKDSSGGALAVDSWECEKKAEVPCEEPVTITKWMHRSCCAAAP